MRLISSHVSFREPGGREINLFRPVRWEQSVEDRIAGWDQVTALLAQFVRMQQQGIAIHVVNTLESETMPQYKVGCLVITLNDPTSNALLAGVVMQSAATDDPVLEMWTEANLVLIGYGSSAAGLRLSDGRTVFQVTDALSLPLRDIQFVACRQSALVIFELTVHCYGPDGSRLWRFEAPDVITAVFTENDLVLIQDFSGSVHKVDAVTGLAPSS